MAGNSAWNKNHVALGCEANEIPKRNDEHGENDWNGYGRDADCNRDSGERKTGKALEQFQSTVEKLTLENDTLTSTQKEFNLLKTHLDTAQSEVKEWRAKAKSDAELVKKREKEVNELQGQVKSLTSRLEHHVKRATIDENNKAGIVQLRTQIGTLVANNVELNVALKSKKRIVEQLEIQLIQHKEKVKELEDRKDDLIAERNELENKLLF